MNSVILDKLVLDARGPGELITPPPQNGDAARDLATRAAAVASIAAQYAVAVDRDARFPQEAFDALRRERLLAITLPADLGGEDAGIGDVVDICYRLGQACAATAMIYAMHQTCLACVQRHGLESDWHRDLMQRIAAEQLLLASSTTEGQAGGNVRASTAPIERTASGVSLDRAATVVSYGAEADIIVTTARRSAEAVATDQVLVVFRREDYTLDRTGGWDALGMRGTCSGGFALKATGIAEQILPVAYERIHPQSMVPVSHLAWSAVWAGIAAGAVERARAFARRVTSNTKGTLPPGAVHIPQALASLQKLRGLIAVSLREYERRADSGQALMAINFQAMLNLTKVEASETAVATVMEAGRACGLAGYRNDSEFSVGRHLRDILSAPIMISNDRILANLATTSLLTAVPFSLRI